MEIIGRSEEDVDRVNWVDDLTVATLIALIDRLAQTNSREQFLFREVELDDAYRQADADVRMARRTNVDATLIGQLDTVRELIFKAHDLVGLERMQEAIEKLNSVIEIKIGLE